MSNRCLGRGAAVLLVALLVVGRRASGLEAQDLTPAAAALRERYPVKLVEPLAVGDERVEVTSDGSLRRRYRVWGDFAAEMAAWKKKADDAAPRRTAPPRTFRLGCIFLRDAVIECPDVTGEDDRPLRATFSTPPEFERQMRTTTTQEYGDFTYAFTGGEVRCEWTFETLAGLTWTSAGKQPSWGCQPRAIADQVEKALEKHKDARIDMWVWCAGKPQELNAKAKQKLPGPPYGISYTQWRLHGGYNIACCAPHLPLIVHEVNHRYLDNLTTIEGVQLTLFHGLNAMGYRGGDLGYPDQLAVYRSVYLHVIRPAMWRRFSLAEPASGPAAGPSEPFRGKRYRWDDVADDCWFRLPLLGQKELAELTGLSTLAVVADRKTDWRLFTVGDADRSRLRSPYVAQGADDDTAVNNLVSLSSESCATLVTETGHWLVVRPEVAEVYVQKANPQAPLEAAGWLNEGVRPLLVLRAPAELPAPDKEIGYFR